MRSLLCVRTNEEEGSVVLGSPEGDGRRIFKGADEVGFREVDGMGFLELLLGKLNIVARQLDVSRSVWRRGKGLTSSERATLTFSLIELPRTKMAVLAPFSTATGSRASAARFERAFLGLAGAMMGVAAVRAISVTENG